MGEDLSMNGLFELLRPVMPQAKSEQHVLRIDAIEELQVILDDQYNLLLWKRNKVEAISKLCEVLIKDSFPSIHIRAGREENVYEMLEPYFKKYQGAYRGSITRLINDINMLHIAFSKICENPVSNIHFRIVTTNACSRFHTDRYHLRLITTYCGPGTIWVANDQVNRKLLGKAVPNHEIIKDSATLNETAPFEVAILKGEAKKAMQGKGIVHKSSPAGNQQSARLVLRIDN